MFMISRNMFLDFLRRLETPVAERAWTYVVQYVTFQNDRVERVVFVRMQINCFH